MFDVLPSIPKCFRMTHYYLAVGIVSAALSMAMGLYSVYAAYWNIDGSFPHPTIQALVHGIFWSGWSILAIWLIAAYFRVCISISKAAITKRGCFLNHALPLSDISQVTWKGMPQSGKVTLENSNSRMKIHLIHFNKNDRTELIRTIRDIFDPALQTGWERFNQQAPSGQAPTPADARHTAKVCALIVFGFAVVLIICGWFQMGTQFCPLGAVCLLVTIWYAWRIRRSKRQTTT